MFFQNSQPLDLQH